MSKSPRKENLLSTGPRDGSSSHQSNNDSLPLSQHSPTEGNKDEEDTLIKHGRCRDAATTIQDSWNWKILAFGQILSFLFASQGAAQSSLHLDCNLSAPTFTTGIVYIVLLVNLIPMYLSGRRMLRSKGEGSLIRGDQPFASYWFLKRLPLHASPWAYFGIALLDVEASYASVMSFRLTTLTSASVFDAMAIPSAMILSRVFLKRKYVWLHLLGVAICLGGIIANVLIDYKNEVKDEQEVVEEQEGEQVNTQDVEEAEEYPHRLSGDLLAILGGLLFGARDVLTEKTIREGQNSMEYLGMIGLFGSVISFIQVLAIERHAVVSLFESSNSSCAIQTGVLLLLSYVVANVVRYLGTARFLFISEAALLNLSLLTGDLWSAVFSVLGEKIVPPPLFWLALVLILGGVLVYEIAPSPIMANKMSDEEQTREDIVASGTSTEFENPEGELEFPQMSRPRQGGMSGML